MNAFRFSSSFWVVVLLWLCSPVNPVAAAGNTLTNRVWQQVQTIFIVAMENHNFTQPNPWDNPPPIKGHPAAPFINSLITPGHSNAVQTAYCTRYLNAGIGVHPSEPSHIWAEAGTDFGVHTDDDPNPGSGNVFTADHLTRQLNLAGISWHNYQEDIEYALSPTNSIEGQWTNVNRYNGSSYVSYVTKHNPMAFFADTQLQNVYSLTRLLPDLTNGTVARYNWITPGQFNDMHSALPNGFTYHGVTYTGEAAAIAEGDHFLSCIIPQIMASPAYTNNGMILIRWDESEWGDTPDYPIPAILISPLCKGNAYASGVEVSHSSVLRTTDAIFGLPFLTNAIPANELAVTGSGYTDVATVNDLGDLFVTVPIINQLEPTHGAVTVRFHSPAGLAWQLYTTTNLQAPINWHLATNGVATAYATTCVVTNPGGPGPYFYQMVLP